MATIPEIMTIREMIDEAFGDPDKNVVHHKLIQTILYLLARQLRMLDRRVKIELFTNIDVYSSESNIVVSEVKIHANVKKKRHVLRDPTQGRGGSRTSPARGIDTSTTGRGSQHRGTAGDTSGSIRGGPTAGKSTPGRSTPGGITRGETTPGGTTLKGTTPGKDDDRAGGQTFTSPSGKALTASESTGLSFSKKHGESTTGRRIAGTSGGSSADTDDRSLSMKDTEKSSTEKSSGDKSSTEKTETSSKEKTSSLKTSTEMSSTQKSSTEKSSTYKSTTGKSLTDQTITESPTEITTTSLTKTSSYDKTFTELTTTDKTLSSDKSSTQKSSTEKSSTEKSTDKSSTVKSSTDKSVTEKTTDKSSTEKSTDKSSTDKSTDKSSTEKSSDKSSTDKTTTEKPSDKSTTEESTDKSTTEKSSTDKTITKVSSTEKSITDKSSMDKSITDKPFTDKSTAKKSTDKTATKKSTDTSPTRKSKDTSVGRKSTDKITTDKTSSDKSASDESSVDDLSTTEKSTTVKSTTEKSSTDKSTTKSSTDKSTTDKSSTEKSTVMSSTDKSTIDKSSMEKSTTDKSSTDKSTTKSSSDKSSTEKTSSAKTTTLSSDKTTTGKTTSSSTKDTTSSSGKHATRHHRQLSEFEMQRERELRIIHQRADSREEHEKSPTPMASLESVEVQYEKLLVVERVPSRLQGEQRGATPRLSIVTQEEFAKLANVVRSLQQKFDPIGAAEFPENIQLMQELRKGASLTDAMAALQLSARLEAAEKALERMTSLVTELASKYPDVDLTSIMERSEPTTEVIYKGRPGPSSQVPPQLTKEAAFKQPPKEDKSKIVKKMKLDESAIDTFSIPALESEEEKETQKPVTIAAPVAEEEKENPDWITAEELDAALKEVSVNLFDSFNVVINKNKANVDSALKMANRLEIKLNASLDLGTRMTDLEALVAQYAEQVNTLDTGLSSQMTNYQEELTQMQHDLESGLENMAEALASTGGDTTAVAELNSHFTNLQLDFETTNLRQNELREIQVALKSDLEDLRREIEILRGIKSDRDEVADALRDKVGLGTLNGLVSLEQFDAVRGDMEQRIGAAYDKFNNQEIIWQKAIDDLLRELSEKADYSQLVFLREDIQMNLEKLRKRLQEMLDIVGEPQAAAVARKVHRDTNCLSCSTPAFMHLVEPHKVPLLPAMPGTRPPTLGAESPAKVEDGSCYPGLPIPHPRDPRAHICNRYCGGSHTKITTTISRVPTGMIISPARRDPSAKTGDGMIKKPCIPCNKSTVPKDKPRKCSESPSAKGASEPEDDEDSDMTPEDFMTSMNTAEMDGGDTTPPVRLEEDM
ncbi:serine-rich adhesin for platelets [Amyelois transitella]|uniref:serine-rich adhesin for platelets n=1 Tax=Amyelois transitella TaxID=680683 RepID=UPI002990588B|nr:serine-rich adhesin for platelets [Amyelois transitella]